MKKMIEDEVNKYSGHDFLMECGDCNSIRTLKLAYRKHVMDDDSIGWEELSNVLLNALCEIMGDDEFCKWKETL